MYDHNGDRVSPEEVLDAEELGSYYAAHPARRPQGGPWTVSPAPDTTAGAQ